MVYTQKFYLFNFFYVNPSTMPWQDWKILRKNGLLENEVLFHYFLIAEHKCIQLLNQMSCGTLSSLLNSI